MVFWQRPLGPAKKPFFVVFAKLAGVALDPPNPALRRNQKNRKKASSFFFCFFVFLTQNLLSPPSPSEKPRGDSQGEV